MASPICCGATRSRAAIRSGAARIASIAAPDRRRVAPAWKIAAIADFNGDGASDILWRDSGHGRQHDLEVGQQHEAAGRRRRHEPRLEGRRGGRLRQRRPRRHPVARHADRREHAVVQRDQCEPSGQWPTVGAGMERAAERSTTVSDEQTPRSPPGGRGVFISPCASSPSRGFRSCSTRSGCRSPCAADTST